MLSVWTLLIAVGLIRVVTPECACAREMRIAQMSSPASKNAAPKKSKKKTEAQRGVKVSGGEG